MVPILATRARRRCPLSPVDIVVLILVSVIGDKRSNNNLKIPLIKFLHSLLIFLSNVNF